MQDAPSKHTVPPEGAHSGKVRSPLQRTVAPEEALSGMEPGMEPTVHATPLATALGLDPTSQTCWPLVSYALARKQHRVGCPSTHTHTLC